MLLVLFKPCVDPAPGNGKRMNGKKHKEGKERRRKKQKKARETGHLSNGRQPWELIMDYNITRGNKLDVVAPMRDENIKQPNREMRREESKNKYSTVKILTSPCSIS